MSQNRNKIYVGYDSRQDIAYQVCRYSILSKSAGNPHIYPIKIQEMIDQKLYDRKEDPLASTEFTYTRFLVPTLTHYTGWALFVDCDFIFTDDIGKLFAFCDSKYALMCVKHDHRPMERTKMDGRVQTLYPRKNWSSLMLWNCGHPANAILTPEIINGATGAYLHRFQWLTDDLIGEIPSTWNWLEGWSSKPKQGLPKGIHYTRGGPWYNEWRHVDYADEWLQTKAQMDQNTLEVS